MSRYRTKAFEIEAVQFTGENWKEVQDFCGTHPVGYNDTDVLPTFDHAENWWTQDSSETDIIAVVWDYIHETWVGVRKWDYIIKGMLHEFYPCTPRVFNTKYEEIK
jgi:hypothetical protein